MDDKQEPAYVNLGKISLEDGAYGDSEKLLSRALTLTPSDPEAVSYLADAQFLQGKYDQVVAAAQHLHGLSPRHAYPVVHFLAANALERTNRPKEAVAEYRLFLEEDPANRRASSRAALSLWRQVSRTLRFRPREGQRFGSVELTTSNVLT